MPNELTKKKERKLTLKERAFCQLYASDREFFGNGVQSYVEAYNPPKTNPNWYKNARMCASNLLTKVDVCNEINKILELRGLNDCFVDKQLEYLITQYADNRAKITAIQEYNKLRQRITEKRQHLFADIDNATLKQQVAEGIIGIIGTNAGVADTRDGEPSPALPAQR